VTPRISVIIPTLDRPEQLRRCLESLAHQSLRPHEYEVIVVDDGGSRPLNDVVASFRSRLQIVLYRQPRSGPGAARNTGAQYARGCWLAFTDDDCRADRNWLKELIACLERHDNAIVGGRIRNALVRNVYAATSQLLVSYLYEYFNADPLDAAFFTSNNIAVSADRFRRSGGFAFRYPVINAEDRELCSRWRSLGERLVYTPDAVVHHSHQMTFRRFFRQHFHYGRGAYAYHRVRAERRSGRFRVEPLTFYRRLAAMPFRTEIANPMTVSGLLCVAQAANAAGFFWEAARRQRRGYDTDLVALEWRVPASDYRKTGS
jgi:GT2 family glycosyltransferase